MASYTAHTTVCVDMALPGVPITTLGVKPIDAHVNSVDQAYLLEDYEPLGVGPMIGTWLYTLKQDGGMGGFTTNEIQRRDLLNRVAHTFTTYAKIPSSMWADMHDGVQYTNAWITIIKNTIYLMSFVKQVVVNAVTPKVGKSSVWRLDGVDEAGNGTFTLVHQTTGAAGGAWYIIPNASQMRGSGMAYVDNGWQPTWGWFGQVLTNVPITVTDWDGTVNNGYKTYTLAENVSFTPWFFNGSIWAGDRGIVRSTTSNKLAYRLNSNWPIYGPSEGCSYDVLNQFDITSTDNYGNTITGTNLYPISSGPIPPPTYQVEGRLGEPLLNGKLLGSDMWHNSQGDVPTYPMTMLVASYQYYNDFAIEVSQETTYANYNPLRLTGNKTSSVVINGHNLVTQDYTGPLVGPPYTGTVLAGVWGNGNTVVMNSARSSGSIYANNYGYYYVCKASDTSFANKYSIFSKVNADGTILHLEGVEDVTPSLWLDNTKLSDLNGPGVSALYTMGENIYKFNTSRDMVSMTYVSPDLNFDSRHERKRFKFLEFHGRGSAAVRVFVDGRLVNSGNVDATENPSKGRKYLLPRGTRGYTLRFEVSGKIEIRLVEIGYEPMPWTS